MTILHDNYTFSRFMFNDIILFLWKIYRNVDPAVEMEFVGTFVSICKYLMRLLDYLVEFPLDRLKDLAWNCLMHACVQIRSQRNIVFTFVYLEASLLTFNGKKFILITISTPFFKVSILRVIGVSSCWFVSMIMPAKSGVVEFYRKKSIHFILPIKYVIYCSFQWIYLQ